MHIKLPLLEMINKSLRDAVFPKRYKIEKIKPILKTGDKTIVANYRPMTQLISLPNSLKTSF